ncbi:hypothetical protein Back11_20220 [Paenibacillus baekrokdamisoli]|uniref:Uncharacterized protein n=1 Tax=Paenibacillus baekrokdamisoli TaxID=1712516 RepID=A0A3G9IP90_9BACL|nr:response regulator [Paenibacillus baekrokdamisoli]MBB3069972.1 two-component system response regulator YesN [Paenibacillus baekrokdamisoli]BBH20677.1 hypothetical protein Back11_20220 [Paenibacillus baekrokdamisoli]
MIKVVIVDDEHWNRDIVRMFGAWEQFGMEIVGEADDGLDAVQVIEQMSPQIVITDMRMPGVDGIALLQILNERFPEIKIIVVSGYDDFNYTKHAIRYKAEDYLLKPVDPKELNAALQKCKDELAQVDDERRLVPMDLELSQKLSSLKQLLRYTFNDLNEEGLAGVFEQLNRELGRNQAAKPKLLERVIQEMLLFMKELAIDHSIEIVSEAVPIAQAAIVTSADAVAFLSQSYLQAMEQLIQQRKNKNRLNLEEVRKYMERNFAEPISLEQLAKAFFVSKEYLSKMFKQEYGRNVTDYILHIRMDKARDWLTEDHFSIKMVAEMVGYEDVSYFYRVFRKHFGIAPGEMRRRGQV